MSFIVAVIIVGVLFFPEYVGKTAAKVYSSFRKNIWS